MRAKLPDGTTKTIDMTGLDDSTLVGAPYHLVTGNLEGLKRNDTFFVGQEAAKTRLKVQVSENMTRPLAIGDVLEINDRRAIVAGLIKTPRNFVFNHILCI